MRAINNCFRLVALGLMSAVAVQASAQPMPLANRTAGLLIGDNVRGKVYLIRDADNDGVVSESNPDEVKVFLDGANASGLGNPSGQPTAILQTVDGTVYIADNTSKVVYACRDTNGNGTCNDAGEARAYFNAANATGLPIGSLLGLGADSTGAIYILHVGSGTGANARDGIYRTRDLDADGNANGAGESALWCDLFNFINSGPPNFTLGASSATDMCVLNDAVYFMDLRGGQTDAILRARDENASGAVDAAELNTFLSNGDQGVATGLSSATDGTSIYTHENLGSSIHRIFRLTDLNNSRTIDDPGERLEVWNQTFLPSPPTNSNSFAIAFGPGGDIAYGTSSGTRMVAVLHDGDADGKFISAGETRVLVSTTTTGVFPGSVRQLAFYAAVTPCPTDFNHDGQTNPDDLADYINAYFSQPPEPSADINGDGVINPDDLADYIVIFFGGCS